MKYIAQSKETLLVTVRNEGVAKAEKKWKKYKKKNEELCKNGRHNKYYITTPEFAGKIRGIS